MKDYTNAWKSVLRFYKYRFGYPHRVTDYLASREMLKMCCMGLSNDRISLRQKVHVSYVRITIKYYFGFDGWNRDLGFSPVAVYNDEDVQRDYEKYRMYIIQKYTWESDERMLEFSYKLCSKREELEKELENYD